jgi:branched-chain amino acid transport system ATP-binding protein
VTRPLLWTSGLIVRRGGIEVLDGIDLEVQAQEVAGIIGPNGAGKSTLLGARAGLYPVRAGEVWFDGRGVRGAQAETLVGLGISLVPERRQIFARLTVRENLLLGAYLRYRRDRHAVREDLERTHRIFPPAYLGKGFEIAG